jgi:putative ABC transport system ATP-binding protein
MQAQKSMFLPTDKRSTDESGVLNGASIHLQDVVKTFKSPAGEFPALRGVNIDIRDGEFVAVVGKSGSGKSTLLNMITGIDHPTTGQVVVGGTDIYRLSESQRALWRGKNLGIVFQFFQLLPMLTLLENTILPMDYCNVYRADERPERALQLLDMVGLASQAYKLPAAVSAGQQQSAAIARALATNPPIIVADEPTGNLDSRAAQDVIGLFESLVAGGKTVVIVTHDPYITRLTGRTLIISDGEIIDENIARALPLLNHNQMLEATHLVERLEILPGETVIEAEQQVNYFYMIESGEVEIVLRSPKSADLIVTRMGKGDFFGEVELLHGGSAIADVRASEDSAVRLLRLHREPFCELMAGSPLTEEALCRIVQARMEENRSLSRSRRKHWWTR